MSDFWSRRRAAVTHEAEAHAAEAAAAQEAARDAAMAERPDAELLAEADQPLPETLESAEAVREFLATALPQRLKVRALRRLWRLNPVLANMDGLIDYGEDFTDSATVIEDLQTAYQVGKGMWAHVEAMARKAEAAAEAVAPEAPETDDPVEASPGEAAPEPAAEPAVATVPAPEPEIGPEIVAPARRRMTFTFDERRIA